MGAPLVTLESVSGSKRKLDALLEEEQAFEAAVAKGNRAARRDLEAVREEIARLSSRAKAVTVASDVEGVVVEVLVAPGDRVRAGQPVARIEPR
jgi:biotin carboxyl carrier protein